MTTLSPDRIAQLVAVFLAENAKLNLSALRTEEACRIGNVLDSLAFLELLPSIGNPQTLLDLGTGGGFPLLPLAMALPEMRLTGMDSTGKKVEAVKRIAASLGIENATLVQARAEEAGHQPQFREKYDVVTARALSPLPTLLEYVSPFVKVNGHAVLWKSLHIDEELAASDTAQKSCALKLEKHHRYTLPGDFGERQLLVFRKTKALDRYYPRAVGVPKKTPIA